MTSRFATRTGVLARARATQRKRIQHFAALRVQSCGLPLEDAKCPLPSAILHQSRGQVRREMYHATVYAGWKLTSTLLGRPLGVCHGRTASLAFYDASAAARAAPQTAMPKRSRSKTPDILCGLISRSSAGGMRVSAHGWLARLGMSARDVHSQRCRRHPAVIAASRRHAYWRVVIHLLLVGGHARSSRLLPRCYARPACGHSALATGPDRRCSQMRIQDSRKLQSSCP